MKTCWHCTKAILSKPWVHEGWRGNNMGNCFTCIYIRKYIYPLTQLTEMDIASLCMYNCVCDGLGKELRRTIALSALTFHIFLWHCERSLFIFNLSCKICLKILFVYYAPLRRREGILLCCCLSVGRSVGPPIVSVHFLRTGCTYWNEICYMNLSYTFLGEVLFWVRSSHFCLSYGPWTSKNSNNLKFLFIFFALVGHIEMKFGIQIYRRNI
jgi:hypothetical protein